MNYIIKATYRKGSTVKVSYIGQYGVRVARIDAQLYDEKSANTVCQLYNDDDPDNGGHTTYTVEKA